MCGISGELRLDGGLPDPEAALKMRDRLAHRGPDDAGIYMDGAIALGNRRLSVLDLSPQGHLPFVDAASGLVLAYNGEIYNFRELRADLEAKGEAFRSTGDAEVVLKLLARDGEKALPRLRGMFAIACWDPRKRTLLLARDPFGLKPLYLRRDGQRLLFASEIKSLREHPAVALKLSPLAVSHYFAFGHVGSGTIHEGIEKLPPGSFAKIDLAKPRDYSPLAYWDPVDVAREPGEPKDLLAVLGDSVAKHFVSDVPVGLFLSGGMDSSALAALASKAGIRNLETFCVGFEGEEGRDERFWARLVARTFGTQHHELVLGEKAFADELPFLASHMDEPVGDAAVFPTLALARFARQRVKVVLTGDGGDELLGGYPRYAAEALGSRLPGFLRRLLTTFGTARIKRALRILNIADPAERGAAWHSIHPPAELDALLEPPWRAAPSRVMESYTGHFNRAKPFLSGAELLMVVDQQTKLTDGYCERVDRATMAVGLEARTPFLDIDVARVALKLPLRDKVRGLNLKVRLRKELRGLVPDEILALPKRGFTVPIPDWLRGGLRPLLRDVLAPGAIARRGILRPGAVAALLEEFERGTRHVAERVWLVFAFELWCRAHLDRRPTERSVARVP
jgi:asparagine synthase (glutamine-hydrolysing)